MDLHSDLKVSQVRNPLSVIIPLPTYLNKLIFCALSVLPATFAQVPLRMGVFSCQTSTLSSNTMLA